MALREASLIDGFAWEPGAHGDYEYGTNEMLGAIAHITAGACGGDRAVGLRGYFNTYGPKLAACGPGRTQFSYLDSADWGACEWNGLLTHYEMEKLNVDEDAETYQLESAGLWLRKLIELKVFDPNVEYRDTPEDRIRVGDIDAVRGFVVSHRSLHEVACDEHFDGWKRSEWVTIKSIATGGSPSPVPLPPTPKDDDMGIASAQFNGNEQLFYVTADGRLRQSAVDASGAYVLLDKELGKNKDGTFEKLVPGDVRADVRPTPAPVGVLHVRAVRADGTLFALKNDGSHWFDANGGPRPWLD